MMRGLTLWQPWCAIIVDGYGKIPDPKTIENRPWKPWDCVIGNRIALHAGKKYDKTTADRLWEIVRVPGIREGVKGAIMGTAIVAGYVTTSRSRWWIGPYAWVLEDIRALKTPIPFSGAQGLWKVPPEIESHLIA